jgi:hypothetical protein
MRAAGLGRLASIIPGGLTEAEGSRAAGWLIDGREPDSATAAVGFLATLRASGINVPRQVSVVGYDDSRLAHASWLGLPPSVRTRRRSPEQRWSEQSRESPASQPADRCQSSPPRSSAPPPPRRQPVLPKRRPKGDVLTNICLITSAQANLQASQRVCRQHPRCRSVELVHHYSNLLPGPETLAELRDRAKCEAAPGQPNPARQVQHRLGPARIEELIAAYRRGATAAALAVQFQIHRTTVAALLQRQKIGLKELGVSEGAYSLPFAHQA